MWLTSAIKLKNELLLAEVQRCGQQAGLLDASAYAVLGQHAGDLGHLELAIDCYTRGLDASAAGPGMQQRIKPKDLLQWIAMAYDRLGDTAAASEHRRKADRADSWANLSAMFAGRW